jgi:hypothetical protein
MGQTDVRVEVPATVTADASGPGWIAQVCGCRRHEPYNGLFALGASAAEAVAGMSELVWVTIDHLSSGRADSPRPAAVVIRAITITRSISSQTFPDPSLRGLFTNDAPAANGGDQQ